MIAPYFRAMHGKKGTGKMGTGKKGTSEILGKKGTKGNKKNYS